MALSAEAGGLTGAELAALLARLGDDPDEAARRYEEVRRRLVRLFEWRGCAEPEALADETIDRVARKLAGGLAFESPDPYRYFCGVAHHVYQEVLRARGRERRALELERRTPPPPPADDDEDAAARLACLRACLARLAPEQRTLILDYYREERGAGKIAGRRALADRLALEMNALRIRAHRIRKGLEECVAACVGAAAEAGMKRPGRGGHPWT